MESLKKKVYVGMSGGVDSSVSAALLKEAGYDVTGVFITVWQPDFIVCTSSADRLDAMRVCTTLGIPFRDLDLSEVYKKEVVDYMVHEYEIGRTPNPDVMCNQHVKFGAFFDFAMREGADYVATGHYARVEETTDTDGTLRHTLHMGNDAKKDQSYFLWTLTERQLAKTLFPVGTMEKPEVRKEAERFNLPTATKKDSQGLCFIGKLDLKEFLSHFATATPGKVLDENGKEIGTHDGALFYTLGERHGFSIKHHSPTDPPLYVIQKDVANNTITVSPRLPGTPTKSAAREVVVTAASWTRGYSPDGKTFQGRFRYRQTLFPVVIKTAENGSVTALFEHPIDFVPIGQSLVIYDQSECLGGGIIDEIRG
jgi:tRNA-specific 2-thiouridylase